MKRLITLLATLFIIVSCTTQQGDVVEEKKQAPISNSITQIVKKDTLLTKQQGNSIKKSRQDSIFDMLSRIVEVQDSTYNQRMRAYKNYMKAKEESRSDADSSSIPTEYSVLSNINDNTAFDFLEDDFSLSNLVAILLSLAACVYAIKQYRSQNLTEEHTKNVPISVQKGKIQDLPRHFYRNLVVTCAVIYKFIDEENKKNNSWQYYPSEIHFYKLQTLPDDILLPIDIDEKYYKQMHELRLLYRNYNLEIQVAIEHFKRADLHLESLKADIDNMLVKPFYLTNKTFGYGTVLGLDIINQLSESVETVVKVHLEKVVKLDNLSILMNSKYLNILRILFDNEFEYIHNKIDIKGGAIKRSLGDMLKENLDKNRIIESFNSNCYKDKKHASNKRTLGALFKKKEERTTENNNDSKKDEKSITENEIKCQLIQLDKFYMDKIDRKDKFIELFNRMAISQQGKMSPNADVSVEQLYEVLQPYIDYVNKEQWDFETLFYYMLSVDIAIETYKIGMIEY